MLYIRPTQTGCHAFDCYHKPVFTEDNCRLLFSFLESDTSTIKEMLLTYFDTVIDTDSLTVRDKEPAKELTNGIKKEMEKLHPYLASNQYISVFRMLAEHLNRQIMNHGDALKITEEAYESLLQALVHPLFAPGIHPMPPDCVPTSNVFVHRCYLQLIAMRKQVTHVAGLDYLDEIRSEAERYVFWVLDRSCHRFKDIDRDTRVRLYSRVFRESTIGPDMRMEYCCYWEEPERYDYYAKSATGLLLDAVQRDIPVEQAVSQIGERNREKHRRREAVSQLRTLTNDSQSLSQEMKDFLDSELDAAMSDSAATMFEEYRVDSFDQLIRLQLWFLTKRNAIIKRCRHCDRLFIADRLSSDYCSRIRDGETEPCDIVGPKKSFARLMNEDHILKTYNRVYKTIYARKKRGSITDEEFNRWKTEARRLLDKTRAGGMGEEEFEAWLTRDIRSWGDSGRQEEK